LLDRTRSHLGKYTFVTKGTLPSIDQRDIDVLMEKNLQARRAVSRNIWKFSIPDLSRVEKTMVSIVIIANGLSKDQKNPKIEL
jgi:hypothetical protein